MITIVTTMTWTQRLFHHYTQHSDDGVVVLNKLSSRFASLKDVQAQVRVLAHLVRGEVCSLTVPVYFGLRLLSLTTF